MTAREAPLFGGMPSVGCGGIPPLLGMVELPPGMPPPVATARQAGPAQGVGIGLSPPAGLLPGAGGLLPFSELPQSSPSQAGAGDEPLEPPLGGELPDPPLGGEPPEPPLGGELPESPLGGVEPLLEPPQSSPSQAGGKPLPPLPPLGGVEPFAEPPQSSPSHAGGEALPGA